MSRSDEELLTALLLANRLTPTSAAPFGAREFWGLLDRLGDAQLDAEHLAASSDDPERIDTLLDARRAFVYERERLEEAGMSVVCALDTRYPTALRERLGVRCPAFLVVAGDIATLGGGGLGITTPISPSTEDEEVALTAAVGAAERGWGVVTGFATATDERVVAACTEAGGQVIGVPSGGLDGVARHPLARRLVHVRKLCLASPYPPASSPTAATAAGRNPLLAALSTVSFVIGVEPSEISHLGLDRDPGPPAGRDADPGDGWGRVAVWAGGDPPARAAADRLVDRGGHPITGIEQLFESPLPCAADHSGSTLF